MGESNNTNQAETNAVAKSLCSSNSYLFLVDSRTEVHAGHSTQRILSEEHDKVGLSGEFAFGEFSGLWPDTRLLTSGDRGVDFTIAMLFTVDVKTYRKPGNLIHEQGKPFADIFVLAKYDEDTGKSSLLGWEWGTKLKSAPVKDFGYGVINHYIPANHLRSMDELKNRLSK
jgi:hypothetical protein